MELNLEFNEKEITDHQHQEENDGPNWSSSHLKDDLGVGDEHEAGPAVDDLLDLHPLVVRHVPEDTEGDHAGEQTGPCQEERSGLPQSLSTNWYWGSPELTKQVMTVSLMQLW